ncbi:MAG: HisA/HisF family protein [Gammaproteobacteria bacterium]|nr:MAG: HisA/HisF family protein [Gammaproteobacteria bacterium]
MGGNVVHAQGGNRDNYPLLESVLSSSHEPIQLVADLLRFYSFSTIYIADLDAIEKGEKNTDLYAELSARYPGVQFFLDMGIKDQAEWQYLMTYSNIKAVIGSESLQEIEWLKTAEVKDKSILSLDFKQGQFLGNTQLLQQVYWSERIIVMNIDRVGAQQGPDITLLKQLQQQTSVSRLIAAGGVRNQHDLAQLQQQGINQVLIASALHDGRITSSML